MSTNASSPTGRWLPPQKVPQSRKTKKWYQQVIEEYERMIYSDNFYGRSSNTKKKVNYELFNGRLNRDDFLYVLNPYGFSQGEFPANLQHYDIISPKLLLLLGEEVKRPLNYHVVNTSPEMVSLRQKKAKELLIQILMQQFGPSPEEQQAMAQQGQQPQTPAEVEAYLNTSWKDDRSVEGQRVLRYLDEKLRLRKTFNEGFKDALIAGEEIYWVGVVGGEPVVRGVNPLDVTIIMDPDSDNIADAEAVIEERWLTISSIIDEFYDELTDKQIKDLEAMLGKGTNLNSAPQVNYQFETAYVRTIDDFKQDIGYYKNHDTEGNIRVIRVEWKSFRKVGFLSTVDPMGFKTTELVSEDFEVPETANKVKDEINTFEWQDEMTGQPYRIKWNWISEVMEGTKIGDDIFVECQAKPNQRRDMDNPSKCKLGYVGRIYSSRNSESISLIDRMKPYQYLYNIIYYRTELAFAKSKGRLTIMDLAQIPESYGIDLEKWMYYAESMGYGFINSQENQKFGDANKFNQFTSIDQNMGNFIQQHVMMLEKIEDEIGELAGVPRQRLGQVQTSELVGNTQRVVTQSSHVTEYYFFNHDEVKRQVMEALLDATRVAWREGKKIHFVLDDASVLSFQLDENVYSLASFGVLVTNSTKDAAALEALRSLAQSALQSGITTFSGLVKVFKSDSLTEIGNELKKGEQELMQRQQEQAQREQEAQQMAMQAEQARLDREDRNKELDRQNKIEIAMIQAQASQPDPMDNFRQMESDRAKIEADKEKLAAEKEKIAADKTMKEKELEEEKRSNKANEDIKRAEMKSKEKIAKMKPKPQSK